jgi:hypothetical protein
MITKNDCLLLLADLKDKGVDTSVVTKQLMSSASIDMEVLKFINDNRQLDLTAFYEKIRKSYNNKKSNLYINIVKEIEEPQEVLTTLSAMMTQILLFSKNLEDKQMFFKHSRVNEIVKVLNNYFITYDLTYCIKLIKLIKLDIKALESIK